jgi:hypothetical protein
MSFKTINNITGWIVGLIACATYVLTMEASGSLWDCGEFVSSAYRLQIPHPPGAPLFTIMGRISIVLFYEWTHIVSNAAAAVNLMNALASGITILFLFWTITHFARRIVQKGKEELTGQQIFSIMAAGVVGALAYCFSDSFWFSAVEGEVYSLSSFFTAIVFWAMLKWEHEADDPRADRWIVLIFFLMGLSIGVHLLNLLTIPAIVMIYYYRRYTSSTKGVIIAFLIGCAITGIVQKAVIQYSIAGAGYFDVFFVNSFGLPFFSGFTFFFVALAVGIWYGLKIANKRGWSFLRLGLWCFAFMLVGYSSYISTLIRSNADPGVDMFNVDNPMSLVGYLSREQYGDFPLVYGQNFTARPTREKGKTFYIKGKDEKGKDKYLDGGVDINYKFNDEDKMFFPRMWDINNDRGQKEVYQSWTNLEDGEAPTFADNIEWFWKYQMNWMYWRYFMWNFSGRQNDIQGFGPVRDGNWITGISFLDNARLGDQSKMPDSIRNNKAHNKLYMLPLILGIIGLIFHYSKNRKDFIVTFILFFFTGIAIVLYLNQAGNQPRERDYAYVGSFYVFAIWIGLGVMQIYDWLRGFAPAMAANLISAGLCTVAVPVLMAQQEWDDHDRSHKELAKDLGRNYLESCAPNAILFSFGDNDTYPLWYAQEVEGIRRDVRVINFSLLSADWYINQCRYKINESDSIDVIWQPSQIKGTTREVIYYQKDDRIPQNYYANIEELMRTLGDDDKATKVSDGEDSYFAFPTKNISVPVDQQFVRENGTVNPEDSVEKEVRFTIPKDYLYKNESIILCIIAANKWKRPIYFTSNYGELGFGDYVRKDGMSYRFVPVRNTGANSNWEMDKLIRRGNYDVNLRQMDSVISNKNKWGTGNCNLPGVYFDEENRRHLLNIRLAYAELAGGLAMKGKKEEARRILKLAENGLLESNFPYGMVSRYNMHNSTSIKFMEACYKAEDTVMAKKVYNAIHKDLLQQQAYYNSLSEDKQEMLNIEKQQNEMYIRLLDEVKKMYEQPPLPTVIDLPKQINASAPVSPTIDSNRK